MKSKQTVQSSIIVTLLCTALIACQPLLTKKTANDTGSLSNSIETADTLLHNVDNTKGKKSTGEEFSISNNGKNNAQLTPDPLERGLEPKSKALEEEQKVIRKPKPGPRVKRDIRDSKPGSFIEKPDPLLGE